MANVGVSPLRSSTKVTYRDKRKVHFKGFHSIRLCVSEEYEPLNVDADRTAQA